MDLTVHITVLLDIWWNMLIKFSKQIGTSLTKIINTRVNSRPWQTSEMKLLSRSFLGLQGNSESCKTSRIKLFAKIVKNEKQFTFFVKISILDVWQCSEYASELASKVTGESMSIPKVTDNLLGKTKTKEPVELLK